VAEASVAAAQGEIELSNNTDTDAEDVVLSSDPNDKLVQPEGCGSNKNIVQEDEQLSYTILFENKPEASAEAVYVLIVDTLDPNLDWGTLQIGPTSHDEVVSIDFDPFSGELMWFFDGLMLPPNVNPPEGEGFVAYSITPKSGTPEETTSPNRAQIRFDYNEWIPAPESGALDVIIAPCPSCDCPYQSDFDEDGFLTALDLSEMIDILFAGHVDVQDPNCPGPRADFDCDGFSTALDLSGLIDHLFAGGDGPCEPCVQ
jgi:hypothetical protein